MQLHLLKYLLPPYWSVTVSSHQWDSCRCSRRSTSHAIASSCTPSSSCLTYKNAISNTTKWLTEEFFCLMSDVFLTDIIPSVYMVDDRPRINTIKKKNLIFFKFNFLFISKMNKYRREGKGRRCCLGRRID